MKKRKLIIIPIIIITLILIMFLIKNNYNFSKNGNNISNKSADKIKEDILNMESYYANANITVQSNKTKNTYVVEQKYNKESNLYKQKVLSPDNINGVEFLYDGSTLKVTNTKLNINKIYENYKYIGSNELSLAAFVESCKNTDDVKCYEENKNVIIEVQLKNGNNYTSLKKLYINKEKDKIEKMEINDITQNTRIYILYNEIEINTLPKEEALAFSVETFKEDI